VGHEVCTLQTQNGGAVTNGIWMAQILGCICNKETFCQLKASFHVPMRLGPSASPSAAPTLLLQDRAAVLNMLMPQLLSLLPACPGCHQQAPCTTHTASNTRCCACVAAVLVQTSRAAVSCCGAHQAGLQDVVGTAVALQARLLVLQADRSRAALTTRVVAHCAGIGPSKMSE
jgi:hypothetical protein